MSSISCVRFEAKASILPLFVGTIAMFEGPIDPPRLASRRWAAARRPATASDILPIPKNPSCRCSTNHRLPSGAADGKPAVCRELVCSCGRETRKCLVPTRNLQSAGQAWIPVKVCSQILDVLNNKSTKLIVSFSYFQNVIEGAGELQMSDDYWRYLRLRSIKWNGSGSSKLRTQK